MIAKEGSGWRLAWDPSRDSFPYLIGGEGWALNDTQTVTLDQALTNYNFVVKVMKIETTKVKADIKAIV